MLQLPFLRSLRARPLVLGLCALTALVLIAGLAARRALGSRQQELLRRASVQQARQRHLGERPSHVRPPLPGSFTQHLAAQPHAAPVPLPGDMHCGAEPALEGTARVATAPAAWQQALAAQGAQVHAALLATHAEIGDPEDQAPIGELATLAKLAVLEGRRLLEAGDVPQAAATCLDTLALHRDAGLVSWNVRQAVALCLDVLNAAPPPLRRGLLAPLLTLSESFPTPRAVLEAELLREEAQRFGALLSPAGQEQLRRVRSGRGALLPLDCSGDPATVPGNRLRDRWRPLAGVLLRARPLCELRFLGLWTRQQALVTQILDAVEHPREQRDQDLEELTWQAERLRWTFPTLSQQPDGILDHVGRLYSELVQNRTFLELLLAAVALSDHQARSGAWPRTLASVLPAGASEPQDTLLNRPLSLLPTGDGRLALTFGGMITVRALAATPGPALRMRNVGPVVLLTPSAPQEPR